MTYTDHTTYRQPVQKRSFQPSPGLGAPKVPTLRVNIFPIV